MLSKAILSVGPRIGAAQLIFVIRILALSMALTTAAWTAPVFLGAATADLETKPQGVIAGQKKEFVLTLTSGAAESPELSGDLAAIAGGLAAPIFSNRALELQRVGETRAGVQQFKFQVNIPAAERKQALLLRLRIRPTATENWLPLPAVMLEAWPQTWKATLRSFARQVPSGRLAGSDRLQQLFHQAEIETPETPAEEPVADQTIRVWFVEATGEEFRPPAAPQAMWVVFKKNVRGGLELWRPAPQAPPCVVVDAGILAGLDSDPAAQDVFERALATARILTSASPDPAQSQP
jgi:hypothetical protein